MIQIISGSHILKYNVLCKNEDLFYKVMNQFPKMFIYIFLNKFQRSQGREQWLLLICGFRCIQHIVLKKQKQMFSMYIFISRTIKLIIKGIKMLIIFNILQTNWELVVQQRKRINLENKTSESCVDFSSVCQYAKCQTRQCRKDNKMITHICH